MVKIWKHLTALSLVSAAFMTVLVAPGASALLCDGAGCTFEFDDCVLHVVRGGSTGGSANCDGTAAGCYDDGAKLVCSADPGISAD